MKQEDNEKQWNETMMPITRSYKKLLTEKAELKKELSESNKKNEILDKALDFMAKHIPCQNCPVGDKCELRHIPNPTRNDYLKLCNERIKNQCLKEASKND